MLKLIPRKDLKFGPPPVVLASAPQLPASGFSAAYAEAQLCAQGLDVTPRPAGELPTMPHDVTRVSDLELGQLYGRMSNFVGHLENRVAIADVDSTEEDARFGHVKARVYLTKSGTVSDKGSKASEDPLYLSAEARSLEKGAVAKLLKAKLREFIGYAASLSREQSRREAERRDGGGGR